MAPDGIPSLLRSLPIRTDRWDRRVAELDPEHQAEELAEVLINHVFALEFLVALELAQLRTFGIPSISAILHSTGQYEREGQKRLDDTRAILTEIHRPGLDSRESHEMVEHLNRIHALYPISNDDFLYVLSTFVFDPVLFIAKWGHRSLTDREQDSLFFLYKKLGAHMRIEGVPADRHAFFEWRRQYERRAQAYAPQNEAVARGMLRAVAKMVPSALEPLLEPVIVALMDDEGLRSALGLRAPSPAFSRTLRVALAAYRSASRYVNPFEHVKLMDSAFFNDYPTYPEGYSRLRLGPRKVIAAFEKGANGAWGGPPVTRP